MTTPYVPQLRFPQFNEPWLKTKLGDNQNQTTFSKGKGISKADITENGKLPCVRYGELYTTYGVLIQDIQSSTDVPEKLLVLSEGNEVLIPASGETAIDIATAAALQKRGVAIGSDINIIKSNIDPAFLAYYLNSKKTEIAKLAQGNSVVHIYNSQLSELNIFKPVKTEQVRIYSFLGLVDKKIQLLDQKLKTLISAKRYILSMIFSQKIRFENESWQSWRWVELSDLVDIVKRKSDGGDYPIMTISAGRGFLDQTERFSQIIAGGSLSNYTKINSGEFAYNRGASKPFPYGCIYMLEENSSALIPFVYKVFRLNSGLAEFYKYYFESGKINKQLKRLISSSARSDGLLNIGENEFYKVRVPIPELAEQKKISDFISQYDMLINNCAEQVNKFKDFKRGLLQQMFV